MNWTILAGVNLICALLGYSLLAYALARLQWRGRGMALVFLAIVVCGLVWLVPQSIATQSFGWNTVLCPIWFGDWLGAVFSVVLFGHFLKEASRHLEDAARMDGCGPWRTYWHIVLPLVRRALLLSAIFVLMASSILFLAPFCSIPNRFLHTVWILFAGSALATLPVIAVFLFARRDFSALKN